MNRYKDNWLGTDPDNPKDVCNFESSAVISAQNGGSINITDSSFDGNDCSFVYADRTPVAVLRTSFSHGQNYPYINMKGSVLYLKNSLM